MADSRLLVENYDDSKKFYLAKIESEYLDSTDAKRLLKSSKYPDTISVSDLYSLVKALDKDFTAGSEVSPLMLNEDGTPITAENALPDCNYQQLSFHNLK